MLEKFKPVWMVESIYQISAEQLRKHNIRSVFADLDNTLIAWNNPNGTKELLAWIEEMKENNIPVTIISNNSGDRVEKVAEVLNLHYVPRALKPSRRAFRKAAEQTGIPLEDSVMVGDQLLTDVFGANRAGLRSILVIPILNSDAWNTKLNRFIERFIMKKLLKDDPNMRWRKQLG
ncbi:YqeG family HAD IIIA-type phosphatase [Jeotgalibaca caeni]|uniref:YqeG family HAD IIIA-type phosphatase n=1 Tax=Jeotgalibaca caeni TaxID=3028623 RepID=UPI00237E8F75|nr:YqeG family HAD IIIA-type phosphatase [Jeotgalibaca caeni]MDE1547952.1 YqeG family HAD IIIA-type phosphatase [Jeotgalibaca caeni]